VLVLVYSIYITSTGFTTLEYINIKNKYLYIINNINLFSKDKYIDNLLSRLFPIEDDQCYNNDEVLLLKSSHKRNISINILCINNNKKQYNDNIIV
jgi:hypothetical protein